jgi:3-methyladenine DNA glycosylase AlkD
MAVPMFNEGQGWSKDERFFIRKAMGWALRELATCQPEWVLRFVQKYQSEMAGLTYREATRKLPPEFQEQL